jgi:hypothetical protein
MWQSDNFLSIKWVLLIYVILGSVLTHILILPELAKSILSLPVWLIVPYFFGELIKLALHRFKIDFHVDKGLTILSLFLGIYSIVVSSFLLDLLGLQIITENLHFVILSLTFIYMTYDTLKHHKVKVMVVPNSYKTDMLAIVFCLLVSLIPALVNRSVFAFPYGTIETISIPFEQYQPALRFLAHGYLQHPRIYDYVSLGFSSQLFNIDPMSFIWSASFLMMAIFSVGLFLFASTISRSRAIGLLTALVGSFLNMNVFRDIPTLFKANVFLYIFLAPALYLSFQNASRKEYKTKDVLSTLLLLGTVASFFIYMLNSQLWRFLIPANLQNPGEWWSHVWMPSIVVSTAPVFFALLYLSRFGRERSFLSDNAPLVALLIFLCLSMNDAENIAFVFFILAFIGIYCIAKNNRIRLLLYVFVVGVLVFVLFQHYVIALPVSNPISSIIFASFTQAESEAISFSSRFEWLLEINMTSVMNAFLMLGIVATVLSRKRENLLVISAFSLALFLYFFPETFAYRFYREVSIMMACVIAVGLMSMFKILVRRRWSKYSKIVLSTLVIALLIPNLVIPVYQRSYESLLGQSMVSDNEYSAARWIMENMPENTLVISDYATMELLAPLSNKMLPVARMYLVQGLSTEDLQVVWYIKNKLSPTLASQNVWDGRDLFWAPYKWGEGNTDVLTEHVDQGPVNNESQKIEVVQGNYSWIGITHRFETQQDWSNSSSLYLYWFGENTGNKWQIILAAPNDSNWFGFDFYDDFAGWKNMDIQLSDFYQVGSPSLETISYMAIRSDNPNHETWLLGSLSLNHPESTNITYSDILYLRQKIDIADERYAQFANIPYENNTILIILTERTVKWIEQEGINEVWYPVEGPVDPRYVEPFMNCSFLEPVYSSQGELYIFRVKQG